VKNTLTSLLAARL